MNLQRKVTLGKQYTNNDMREKLDSLGQSELYDGVMLAGIERKKAQKGEGKRFSTPDFIAGAMTVLFILERENKIPIHWISMMWKKEDILDEYKRLKEEKQAKKTKEKKQ